MTTPDLSDLRARLDAALDDPQVDALCLDHFPDVYTKFGRGMRRDEKVNLLLDHVRLPGAFPGTRLVVTARVAAYASANTRLDHRFNLAHVRALTREQWAPLIERLYAGLEPNPGAAGERARRLIARIDGADLLQEMVKTPLMVWTAALIHYADRELPEQRAELYQTYVDVLLGERLHEEEGAEAAQRLRGAQWPMDDRRLYLTYAAYRAHEGAESDRMVDAAGGPDAGALVVVEEHDLVRRILAPFIAEYLGLPARQARREATDFEQVMAERSGLLHAQEGGYTFGDHLTIQEFLAAAYLVENVRGARDWPALLRARAGKSWWHDVLLLVGGLLIANPRQAKDYLLRELGDLPEGDDAPDARAYGLAWAGQALLEIPERRVGWHAPVRERLARALVGVLRQTPPVASAAARAAVGDILGRLGDPRFSGPWGLPEFIPLDGGVIWMGTPGDEIARLKGATGKDWPERESLRHQVRVADVAMAKYPTTNGMSARFIKAGGYADSRWWSEAHRAGVWQSGGIIKDFWGERRFPAYWEDERFNGANQPVVGVTWYEALAYCRWLTDVLDDGYRYHLPTEAQWARAARGFEGRRYAWGDEKRVGLANTKELKLERTTPVGLFPDGATPDGLLDMAGNVWEWCSTLHQPYPYRDSDGREDAGAKGARILRGGSWYDEMNIVRCASRGGSLPVNWIVSNGFRVARNRLS